MQERSMNTRHLLVVLALCTPMVGSAKVWMMECKNKLGKELVRYDNEKKVIEMREEGKWVPFCVEGVETTNVIGKFEYTYTFRAEYRPDSFTCRQNIIQRGIENKSVDTIRGIHIYDFLTREKHWNMSADEDVDESKKYVDRCELR